MNHKYIHSVDSIRNMSISVESAKEQEKPDEDKESKIGTCQIKKQKKAKGRKRNKIPLSQMRDYPSQRVNPSCKRNYLYLPLVNSK